MRNITFILALLFLWPAIAGCKFSSFSTTEKVTFYLPQIPPSGCTYWQISASCPWEVQTFTTTASSFQLQLSKNQPVSVLAQPITKLANNSKLQFFKPAGTIYPYDQFSSKDSFTGEIIDTQNTYSVHHFNCGWLKTKGITVVKKKIHKLLIRIFGKLNYNKILYKIRKKKFYGVN